MNQTEAFHKQAHKITELNNVLEALLSDRSLCDSEVTCELFFRYVNAVKHHLNHTESGVFAQLLANSDEQTCKAVGRFIDGSHEIKRIFSSYTKKWCNQHELKISNYQEFYEDTVDVFNLVLRRLQDETENLYPLIQASQSKSDPIRSFQVA
ncbi:MAG: hypothetical protein HKP55_09470 [Gammaproteobacteria bacterium]|nr:hypothetical protein [Gammaproteobacteria bacterium]